MKKYCLGFMFRKNGKEVLLIRKNHPAWQAGRLNGIGGHIEKGEDPSCAMNREFKEEAGAYSAWIPYCKLFNDEFELHVFFGSDKILQGILYSATDEQIRWYKTNALPDAILPNLAWLIPMALSFRRGERCFKFEVQQIP